MHASVAEKTIAVVRFTFTRQQLTVPASDSAPLTADLQNQHNRGVRCGGVVRLFQSL
jgi:hypothetical protein